MIEKLLGREKINPHAIGNKVNEIIEILNELENQNPESSGESSGETNKKESA